MPPYFFREKIITPILVLLKQGITPEKIAMSLSFGTILGIFPIVGITSLLCIAAAFIFRLNQAMTQIFNWLVYPFQIILVIPFFEFGSYLFHSGPLPLTVHHIVDSYRTDLGGSLILLWDMTVHAIVAWFVTAVPLAVVLYLITAPLLRKMRIGTNE